MTTRQYRACKVYTKQSKNTHKETVSIKEMPKNNAIHSVGFYKKAQNNYKNYWQTFLIFPRVR